MDIVGDGHHRVGPDAEGVGLINLNVRQCHGNDACRIDSCTGGIWIDGKDMRNIATRRAAADDREFAGIVAILAFETILQVGIFLIEDGNTVIGIPKHVHLRIDIDLGIEAIGLGLFDRGIKDLRDRTERRNNLVNARLAGCQQCQHWNQKEQQLLHRAKDFSRFC